jgi:hypothetical protein
MPVYIESFGTPTNTTTTFVTFNYNSAYILRLRVLKSRSN